MWQQLWDDFVGRARRLTTSQPLDVVDTTVSWQLTGHGNVGGTLRIGHLQLPELYSGRSPLGGATTVNGRWLMFLEPNPGIDTTEDVPTDSLFAVQGIQLAAYFEERFARSPSPLNGHIHGRSSDPQFAGSGGMCTHLLNGTRGAPPATWCRLEDVVLEAFGHTITEGLGQVSMIADAVPWKFSNWAGLGRLQRPLLTAGLPYLDHTMRSFRPPVVVVLDGAVRRWIAEVCGLSRVDVDDFAAGPLKGPVRAVWPGSHALTLIGANHPARAIHWDQARGRLVGMLAAAL